MTTRAAKLSLVPSLRRETAELLQKRKRFFIFFGCHVFVAVSVRVLLWTLHYQGHIPASVDEPVYLDIARHLRQGFFNDTRLLFVSPLYPYFLALFGSIDAVVASQLVIGLATSCLVFWYTWREFKSLLAALCAGLLMSFAGAIIWHETLLYPTSLSLFFLIITCLSYSYANEHPSFFRWLVPGLAMTVTVLFNQSLILLPVFLLAFRFPKDTKALRLLLFPLVIAFFAFTVRNFNLDSTFIPLGANSGVTLSHGNNARATGGYSGLKGFDTSKKNQHLQSRSVAENALDKKLSWKEVDAYWKAKAVSFLKADPVRSGKLIVKKISLFLSRSFIPGEIDLRGAAQLKPILKLFSCGFLILFFLAVWGFRKPTLNFPEFWAVFLATLTTCLIFYSSERYRLPALLMLTIPAGEGLARLIRSRQNRSALLGVGILTLFFAHAFAKVSESEVRLTQYNLASGLEARGMSYRAENLYKDLYQKRSSWLVGNAWLKTLIEQDKIDEAALLALKLTSKYPKKSALWNGLGVVFLRQHKVASAREAFEKAVACTPVATETYFNLGVTYEEIGDSAAAVNAFKQYLNLKPEMSKGWYRFLRSLYQLGGYETRGLSMIPKAMEVASGDTLKQSQFKNLEGLFLERLQRPDEALVAYQESHRLDPSSPFPLVNIALNYKEQGDEEQYQHYIDQAKALGAPRSSP